MTNNELAEFLRNMKVETGSLLCLGCGHEHNCGIHGCVILSMAADALDNSERHVAALHKEIKGWRRQYQQLREAAALVAKESAELLERRWIPVENQLPNLDELVLVIASGKPQENITLDNAVELAELYSDGWCLEMWPEWTKAAVTHWMPLPEPLEVENAETK